MKRALLLLLAALSLALPAQAQDWTEPFDWPTAGLLLRLPAGYLAEDDLDAPEIVTVRPTDEGSEIRLGWWPNLDAAAALEGIFAGGSIETRAVGLLLGQMGLHYEGRTPNGELLLVRALDQPEQGAALTVAITSPDADAQALRQTLERIAAGLMRSEDAAVFGILWERTAFASEGSQTFFDVAGLALQGVDRLIVLDRFASVFILDAVSGRTLARIALPEGTEPDALAVAEDGSIAVADSVCGCVHLWVDGAGWSQPLQDFASGAPRFITFAGNTLYATDQAEEGAFVRSLSPDGQASRIFFEDFIEQQPRLFYAAQRGALFVLTSDFEVYEAEGAGFSPRALLATIPDEQAAVTVDALGRFMIVNSYRELLVFDHEGMLALDTLLQWPGDPAYPVDYPVALALDDSSGTLFIAEGSGYGRVLALRADAQPGRIGSRLAPGLIVAAALRMDGAAQAWPLNAGAGPHQITALPLPGSDLALKLQIVDDSGAVLAESAETSLEAPEPGVVQLSFTLDTARDLFLLVTAQSGEGNFQVGMRRTERLGSGSVETRRGAVDAARPSEYWIFDGTAGQRITITMSNLTGTLDPLLRLLDAEGTELTLNDDAENAELGRDAQIFEFRLPASGEYLIEASRFDGVGDYQLDVERLD